MLHLRLIAPASRLDDVCGVLSDAQGVTNVVVIEGAAREPQGDVILCDVARESASEVIEQLRDLGLADHGSIAVETIDTAISEVAEQAEREAPGRPVNAVVWEEVESRTSEESALSASYLIFLVVATIISAIGVLTDSPILIVGAMVVGPEFGPLAALCVAMVQHRADYAVRSLIALAVGFPLAIGITWALTRLGTVAGAIDRDMLEASRPLTSFIWHPDEFSFIVAFLAGVVGMLSLTSAKSGTLVGVLISITTVPAAGNLAVAIAFRDGQQARGSALQLMINLSTLVLAGWVTLRTQRLLADRHHRDLRRSERGAAGSGR